MINDFQVSVKNEKDGIGLKSEKRGNELSLFQCVQFDNMLKSKYGKPSEQSTDDQIIERGLSRAKYGRSVSKDFFKPVGNEAWDRILCKAKTDEPTVDSDEIVAEEASNDQLNDQANFKSNFTIYEYFSMKMKTKAFGDLHSDTFIDNKMDTLHSFIRDRSAINAAGLGGNGEAGGDLGVAAVAEEMRANTGVSGLADDSVGENGVVADAGTKKRRRKGETATVDTMATEAGDKVGTKKKNRNNVEINDELEVEQRSEGHALGEEEESVSRRNKKSKKRNDNGDNEITAVAEETELIDESAPKRKKSKKSKSADKPQPELSEHSHNQTRSGDSKLEHVDEIAVAEDISKDNKKSKKSKAVIETVIIDADVSMAPPTKKSKKRKASNDTMETVANAALAEQLNNHSSDESKLAQSNDPPAVENLTKDKKKSKKSKATIDNGNIPVESVIIDTDVSLATPTKKSKKRKASDDTGETVAIAALTEQLNSSDESLSKKRKKSRKSTESPMTEKQHSNTTMETVSHNAEFSITRQAAAPEIVRTKGDLSQVVEIFEQGQVSLAVRTESG